jgi:peroxiredoxin
MNDEFTKLPDNLPIPENDGTTNHLLGRQIPDVILPSTKDSFFDLSNIDREYGILYFFPMMTIPGKDLPLNWNDIPGARGCTPQNISFSENNTTLEEFDAISIGISSQPIYDLEQLASKRKLSQILVSDNKLEFQKRLDVPTFDVEDKTVYKRLTLVIKNSKIIKVFYPVFPPDKHVFEVLKWLENEN